jgi:hypothetical protein
MAMAATAPHIATCQEDTQMTCRGVLSAGDGQTVNYVDVYDRR